MENHLLLLAGNDIPFPQGRFTIHQPTIKEISFIGENNFFMGSGFLDFSKNLLSIDKDKKDLLKANDFDIFMSMLKIKNQQTKTIIESVYNVFSLIFPLYDIEVRNNEIILIKEGKEEGFINRQNFEDFKLIIRTMFGITQENKGTQYNPVGSMAEKIAQKFKKRQEQLNKLNREKITPGSKINILGRYSSILSIGLNIDINKIFNYTVYQLYDSFQRFQAKMQWDAYIEAKKAGAKDLEEVPHWTTDFQDKENKKIKNKK